MTISNEKDIHERDLAELFGALGWSSAKYPERLARAVASSHTVRSLRDGEILVGLVTAISDGAMCAYFPYVAIHPNWQGRGLGRRLLESALEDYRGFHHIAIVSYDDKIGFYERLGFSRSEGKTALFFPADPVAR